MHRHLARQPVSPCDACPFRGCDGCQWQGGDDLALPPGKWVRKGLIWKYEQDAPPQREADTIVATLQRTFSKPVKRTPRPLCGDCGCLLMRSDERCPACLVTAERQAARSSWVAAAEH